MAEQNITLSSGESKVVSFEATPHEAKTYQVSVDGLTGSFKAVVAPIAIEFDTLSILNIEGIPFAEVGEEALFFDWVAFGQKLHEHYTFWDPELVHEVMTTPWIVDGMGLAMCMREKGVEPDEDGAGALQLFQCGVEHPEYLGAWALTMPAPVTSIGTQMVQDFISRWKVVPYVGLCLDQDASIGSPVESVLIKNYSTLCVTELYESAWGPAVRTTRTYNYPWWYRFNFSLEIKRCLPPRYRGPIAILERPITMDAIRGVSVTWKSKIGIAGNPEINFYLSYTPAFTAPMPAPSFKIERQRISAAVTSTPITNLFAGGYFYPGIYDGLFRFEIGWDWYGDGGYAYSVGGQFMVKNLAKVTGTGSMVPPGY